MSVIIVSLTNSGFITYLFYGKGSKAYLSIIKDSSTNEILAYNVSDDLRLDIVIDTILKFKKNRKIKLTKDAFIHSDQGVSNGLESGNIFCFGSILFKSFEDDLIELEHRLEPYLILIYLFARIGKCTVFMI